MKLLLPHQEQVLVKELGEEGLHRFVKLLGGLRKENLQDVTQHHVPNFLDLLETGAITGVEKHPMGWRLGLQKQLGAMPLDFIPNSNVLRTKGFGDRSFKDIILTKDLEKINPEYAFRFFSPQHLTHIAENQGGRMNPNDSDIFTNYFSQGFPNNQYMNRDWNVPSPTERQLIAIPNKYIMQDDGKLPHGLLQAPTSLDKFIYIDPASLGDVRAAQAAQDKMNREFWDLQQGGSR